MEGRVSSVEEDDALDGAAVAGLTEQIWLVCLVDVIVHDDVRSASALMQCSRMLRNVFVETMATRRLLELIMSVKKIHRGIENELSQVLSLIARQPNLMYREILFTDAEGVRMKTTPFKQALENDDVYIIETCLTVAEKTIDLEERRSLLRHFIVQLSQHFHEAGEVPGVLSYDDYYDLFENAYENDQLTAAGYESLVSSTRSKIGAAQARELPRLFFDVICNPQQTWNETAKLHDCAPPEKYTAYYYRDNKQVDITHLPNGLMFGKNAAMARGDHDLSIKTDMVTEDECETDRNAWYSIFNSVKEKESELLNRARADIKLCE